VGEQRATPAPGLTEMTRPRPPRLAVWLLHTLALKDVRDDVLADMADRFAALSERHGSRSARRWYWRQVVGSLAPAARRALSDLPRDIRHRRNEFTMNGVLQDVRQALRSFRRTPGFTLSALLILALGIGGGTAVFSVLEAVLLRPLPYRDADRLVVMWTVNTRQQLPDGTSAPNAKDWLERSHVLESMTLFVRPEFTTATVNESGKPERVHVGVVRWNFFQVLGVDPIAGRFFQADDFDGDARYAVLSETFWRQRFGGAPNVVGTTIRIDGEDHRILGIVPSGVRLPRPETAIWQLHEPYAPGSRMAMYRGNDAYVVMGRLANGVSVADAQRELSNVAAQLAVEYPETNAYLGVQVYALQHEVVGERIPQVLWMVFAAVLILLIVTATNVAHLLLARGAQRRRELALRTALGAVRGRIVRQLVVENMVLGLAAAAAGIVVSVVTLRGIMMIVPPDVPRIDQVQLDGGVLAFALVMTAMVAPLFGLVPALVQAKQDPSDALREGGRGASTTQRGLRRALVVFEVAMAVVLLSQGALLMRSVRAVSSLDPGFDAEHALVAQIDLDRNVYDQDRVAMFYRELLPRLEAVPGIVGAGAIDDFFLRRFPDMSIRVEGQPLPSPDTPRPPLTSDEVVPGFVNALGVALLSGRSFEATEYRTDGPPVVAIVNRTMGETFWPNESAVGKRFSWPDSKNWMTVVGVIADMRRGRLEDPPFPQIFLPGAWWNTDLVVRTSNDDPLLLAESVRRVVQEIDPDVPVTGFGTAWSRFGESMADRRLQMTLVAAFSMLATLLASIGLYALLHDTVVGRRREIGIRVALGASPGTVRRLILREGVMLASVGMGFGLVSALAVGRVSSGMLYGIASTDPAALGLVIATLLLVATLASWIPAIRATRVQPMETLTSE